MSILRVRQSRANGLRLTGSRVTGPSRRRDDWRNALKMSVLRTSDPRMTVPRERDVRGIALRAAGPRAKDPRESAVRAADSRMRETARSGQTETAASRAEEDRTDSPRIIAAAMDAAIIETARAEETEDSSSQEEETAKMADHRETGRMDFREAAGLALAAVWVIAAARALVRAVTVGLTAARVTAGALQDRELDSEIINPKALREKLRARIWRRSARKKSGAPTARRKASAPGKTISTKRTRH